MTDPRTAVLRRLVEYLTSLRGGAYHVTRGAVNWAAYDFQEGVRGAAVMVEEGTPFGVPGTGGKNRMSLAIEAFTLIPRAPGSAPTSVDDDVSTEILNDLVEAVLSLASERDGAGDALIFKLDKSGSTYSEAHDFGIGVQGIILQFAVDY